MVKFKEPKNCHDGWSTEISGDVAGDGFGGARMWGYRGSLQAGYRSLVSSKDNGRHEHQSDMIRFGLSKDHSLMQCGLRGLEGSSSRDRTPFSTWLPIGNIVRLWLGLTG